MIARNTPPFTNRSLPRPSPFSRRNFLRGAGGATLALPFLPSLGRAGGGGPTAPRRLVVVVQPQGFIMDEWRPTGTGSDFQLSPILSPLEPLRDRIVVVSGLDNVAPDLNYGAGGHSSALKSILTGMPLSANLAPDGSLLPSDQHITADQSFDVFAGGPSIDQVLADRMDAPTPYRSLEFGVGTDSYLHALQVFLRGPDEPLGTMNDPRAAFDRLFADFDPGAPSPLQNLRSARSSVLDRVAGSYEGLAGRVSAADRQVLEAHAQKLRELELRFANGTVGGQGCSVPSYSLPEGYDPHNSDFDDVGAMAQIDMMVMAMACDMTRVASLQFTQGQNNRFPWLGLTIPDVGWPGYNAVEWPDWHGMFHISPDPARDHPEPRAAMVAAMRWYAEKFAYLLQRMAETPDGEGSLLDSSLVVWVSEFGDGAAHWAWDVPVVLAGNVGGALQTGRHLQFPGRVDNPGSGYTTNDLLVSILNLFGYEDTSFGYPDICRGALPGLA
jgi:hypothetical protein